MLERKHSGSYKLGHLLEFFFEGSILRSTITELRYKSRRVPGVMQVRMVY
jgi:hypothetical protein